jgi:hypothetical protein
MENNTIFAEGIYLNTVSEKAPEFIKANVSLHVDKAIAWLEANRALADEKGYIKLTGKESKGGKRYFQVDTWKPEEKKEVTSDNPPF